MKKLLLVVAVGSMLTACASGPKPTAQQKMEIQQAKASVSNIPDWFTDVPKDDNAIFAVGDAVSSSASGALSTARANAFEGICQTAGGKVRSQTKVYRVDTERSSTSTSTTAIRNFCPDVDVTGATVVKNSFVQEGGRIRAFVLVKLPTGDANTLARTKHRERLERQAIGNMKEEFKELDRIAGPEQDQPKVEVKPVTSNDKVVGVTENGKSSEITLLQVDNEEYKKRRDEALQKPGAVVGQLTVR
jgi:hypothetical protein